jgi:hypothetical protein
LLLLILLGGIGWFFLSRNLGRFAGEVVRQQAGKAINGRLEFADLKVDLAGRAVLTDSRLYLAGTPEPVATCARTIVRLNYLTLLGPNRGKRTLVATLIEPKIRLLREPDGSLNLSRLIKPKQENEQQQFGLNVRLVRGELDFTDWALLDQSYPDLKADPGPLADVLAELGYNSAGPAEQMPHHEIARADGQGSYNAEREEAQYVVTLRRKDNGGVLRSAGSIQGEGKRFDITATLENGSLASLRQYVAGAFPALSVVELEKGVPPKDAAEPLLGGTIHSFRMHFVQTEGQKLQTDLDGDFSEIVLRTRTLPDMQLPRLRGALDMTKQTASADFDLRTLGSVITGKPTLDMKTQQLAGRVNITGVELPAVLAELNQPVLPLTGKLSAEIKLAGTTDRPDLTTQLASEVLAYDKFKLGRLSGTVHLLGDTLQMQSVKLTGGEAPVDLAGELHLKTQTGKLTLTAFKLGVQQLADIAARLKKDPHPQQIKATGELALKAEITLAGHKPQTALRVWSDKIGLPDFSVTHFDVNGTLGTTAFKVASAAGTLNLAKPLSLPPFSSDGPLHVALHAAGTITGLDGKLPQLSLSGTAEATNLKPAHASAAFKVTGKAGDPEIRLQAKSTLEGKPVAVTAQGHYRNDWSPVTASLNWQQMKVDFSGKVDPAGQRVDGKLNAAAVDLGHFSGDPALRGILSASATLQGKFDALNIAGKVSAPAMSYTTAQKRYDIEDLSAGFKLAGGNRISISDGRLRFEGNELHAEGTLGKAGSDLTIASAHFNLLSALALVPPGKAPPGQVSKSAAPPLAINSSGPLVLRLTGTLKEPHADIQYNSGPGSVQGHSFSSALLTGTADKGGAHIRRFEIKSREGSLTASGDLQFDPVRFKGTSDVEQFDIGVLAPLLGTGNQLSQLKGRLNGHIALNGTPKQFAADADLALSGGSFRGFALDSAQAKLKADANGLEVTRLTVTSQHTTLNAQGTIPNDPSRAKFKIDAPKVELALLQPFLPKPAPALDGVVQLNIELRPGKGNYPDADILLQDAGDGIKVGGRSLSSVAAQAQLHADELNLQQLDIKVRNSTLRITGTAKLGDFDQPDQRPLPLNMTLRASNFDLADIAPLLPEEVRKQMPGGVITVDPLQLSGTSTNPLLTGSMLFAFSKLPAGLPESIATISGNVTLDQNTFSIKNVDIGTSGAGTAASFGQARITGAGKFALNPPRLLTGAVNIDLSPADAGGKFIKFTQDGLVQPNSGFGGARAQSSEEGRNGKFDGTLGGTLTFSAPHAGYEGSMAVLGGKLIVTEPKGKSTLTLPAIQGGGGSGKPGMRITQLEIVVQDGTEVRFKPGVDLRAGIVGDVTLNGIPGLPLGDPDALRVMGELRLTKGSLVVYRHTIRIEEGGNNILRFSGRPGDITPSFSGRGVIILPNVLNGGDVVNAGSGTPGAPAMPSIGGGMGSRGSRDLKIFFNFNNVKLSPDMSGENTVTLSSEPPRTQEEILRYLAGGVGDLLAGDSAFSDVAEDELIGFGSSWVSRQLEDALGVDALTLGGTPNDVDNPFFVNVEKELNPEVSLTYFRNFFSAANQQEEIGLKYRPFRQQLDSNLQGLELQINFQNDAFRGTGSEFMFTWNKRF